MSATGVIYFTDWICLFGHFHISVCCTNFNLFHFLLWSRIPWKIPIQFSLQLSLALLSIQWSRCRVYMVVNSPLLSTTVLNPERCQWEHPVPRLEAITKIFKLNKIVFTPDIITKLESPVSVISDCGQMKSPAREKSLKSLTIEKSIRLTSISDIWEHY